MDLLDTLGTTYLVVAYYQLYNQDLGLGGIRMKKSNHVENARSGETQN
jgi:hypothetical protein